MFAKRRLLRITYFGQFPNLSEKLAKQICSDDHEVIDSWQNHQIFVDSNLLRSPKPVRVRARSSVCQTNSVFGRLFPIRLRDAVWNNVSQAIGAMAVLGVVRGHYGVQNRFGGSQIRKDRSPRPKRVVIIDRRGIDPFRDSRPTGLNRPLGGCKQVVFGCLIVRQLVCLYHLRTTVGSIWCNLLCFFRVVRDSLPIR